ncbi:MAG: hypothetical protein COA58_03785 [Bacteroidetes bacterium]|nr:MAG: hypothetical protein COA58_03785 [Bacteroidota bacterium]
MKSVKLNWTDVSPSQYPNLKNDLELATETALNYTIGALQLFARGDKKTLLHRDRFFGKFNEDRYHVVEKTFMDIRDELLNGQMIYNVSQVSLSSTNVYGSSSPDSNNHEINIYGKFLKAPLLGQDSKFGVIIHETSHNVVDHILDQHGTYSLADTEALAKNDPDKATHCAECYEYFVEFGVQAGLISDNSVRLEPFLPKIGNLYGGGIIFYVDKTKRHGYIATPFDQSTGIIWGEYGVKVPTNLRTDSGKVATDKIIKTLGVGSYAARLCYDLELNGYSDWYLPNKWQLDKLWTQRKIVGGFTLDEDDGKESTYWTSNDHKTYPGDAWSMRFRHGTKRPDDKRKLFRVRAIRSF